MQEDDDKLILNEKKLILLKTIGQVIHRERLVRKKGINRLSYEYDIGNGLLSRIERGGADTKITTVWKLANAFGYKCSDFIKMIEKELPSDFDFYN